MSIENTCPGCGEVGTVPDSLRGKKVRCKSCQQVFIVGSNARAEANDDEPLDVIAADDDASVRSTSRSRLRPAPRRRRRDEEEDDPPRREVVRSEGGGGGAVWITLGGLGLLGVILIVVCGGLTYWGITSLMSKPKQWVEQAMEAAVPPANVDQALEGLRSTDWMRRQTVANWLADAPVDEARRAEVARAVEPLMDDQSVFVRDSATRAFMKWASREQVPALLKAVNHPDSGIRHAAMDTLARFQDERAAAPIAQRLTDGQDRGTAGRALEKLGKVAEKEVLKYMNHPDHWVRDEARRLLKSYNTSMDLIAPQMLAELRSPEAARRRAAAEWLTQTQPDGKQQAAIAKALEGMLNDLDGQTRDAAARALGAWATAENVPALVKMVNHPTHEVRKAAMAALGRLKDERGVEAVAGRLSDFSDRRDASSALIAMGPVAEKEVLKLIGHPDFGTRVEAKRILQAIGRANVELDQSLADLKSPDPNQRRRAVEWLARAPLDDRRRDEVLRALEPVLRDGDGFICVAAMKAMGTWGTKENVPAVLGVLTDLGGNPGAFPIRHAAMETLVKFKDERAIAPIAARLTDLPDMQVAATALIALGPASEAEAVKYLQPTFNVRTRVEACRVLSAVGGKASVPSLQALVNDRIPTVATAARLALKAIADRGN